MQPGPLAALASPPCSPLWVDKEASHLQVRVGLQLGTFPRTCPTAACFRRRATLGRMPGRCPPVTPARPCRAARPQGPSATRPPLVGPGVPRPTSLPCGRCMGRTPCRRPAFPQDGAGGAGRPAVPALPSPSTCGTTYEAQRGHGHSRSSRDNAHRPTSTSSCPAARRNVARGHWAGLGVLPTARGRLAREPGPQGGGCGEPGQKSGHRAPPVPR
jgi:hypothetical protein